MLDKYQIIKYNNYCHRHELNIKPGDMSVEHETCLMKYYDVMGITSYHSGRKVFNLSILTWERGENIIPAPKLANNKYVKVLMQSHRIKLKSSAFFFSKLV